MFALIILNLVKCVLKFSVGIHTIILDVLITNFVETAKNNRTVKIVVITVMVAGPFVVCVVVLVLRKYKDKMRGKISK